MSGGLSAKIVARMQERAAEATKRSDSAAMASNSVSMDEMLGRLPKSDDPRVESYLEGVNSPLAGMISNLVTGDGSQAKGLMGALGAMLGNKAAFGMMGGQSFSMGAPVQRGPAPPPASEAEVAAAEARLGFPLPEDLRQFYLEVADGGVGMGAGIYSLEELLAKHREMTSEPVGPQGQDWPANLLPIQGEDWDLVSIDRDSGRLIFWDLEELDDDEDMEPDNRSWTGSFVQEADSLEAWLTRWADSPSAAERTDQIKQYAMAAAPKPPSEAELDSWLAENPDYTRRMKMFSMTAEERATAGLPKSGWEDQVWEDFDWNSLTPRPGQ